MFDHMSMPVLFAILIGVLAVLSIGVFLAFRIVGERIRTSDEGSPKRRNRRH